MDKIVFGFYASNDSSKEIISKCKAFNIYEAAEHFAKIKNLEVNKFMKLYTVTDEV